MEAATTGLTQGDFTLLRVLDTSTGQMTDILTLLSGQGIVTSAALPLSISNGLLSIDLSAYATYATIPAVSAGIGVYMSGLQINSYGLRWNSTSTPTLSPVHELHFKGFTITETLNLSTGMNEL